jgi:hypothetical protein
MGLMLDRFVMRAMHMHMLLTHVFLLAAAHADRRAFDATL